MHARFSLLVQHEARVFPVDLPHGRPLVIGSTEAAQLVISGAGVAPRHLAVTAKDDGLHVEPLRGAGPTLLNDVQLSTATLAQAGDELQLGPARVLVMVAQPRGSERPRVAGFDELEARLADEVQRARLEAEKRPFAVVFVQLPPLNVPARLAVLRRLWEETGKVQPATTWSEIASDLLGALIPPLEAPALRELLQRLPGVAGQRARVLVAEAPREGLEAERLLERAFAQLEAQALPVEPVAVEPVMVRLLGLAERLSDGRGPVVVEGAEGSGRATLARVIATGEGHELMAADGAAVAYALAKLNDHDTPWRWVLVHGAESLEREQLNKLVTTSDRAGVRLLLTAVPGVLPNRFGALLRVPSLSDRPGDVLPLAEAWLSRLRVLLSRPRLLLTAEARALLGRYRWPGNVRELKNVLSRAVRSALRDELGRDALPPRLGSELPAESLRGALKATERELLLEALARTRWNVTAAASRLGLPRRTVVYRMSRLGLRRPARS